MSRPRVSLRHFFRGLYYARRENVGILKEEVRRRFGIVCGHTGYITGLFEYIMTDMLSLRCFALAGCAMIVGYQAVQPKIQWISASWNSVYCAINIYHIRLLLLERPRKLSEEEERLRTVLGSHISAAQILSLVEAGEWRRFPVGTVLAEEGQQKEDLQVCVLVTGRCKIQLKGLEVGHLGPGAAVGGELAALRRLEGGADAATSEEPSAAEDDLPGPVSNVTVQVGDSEEALCLCLPWSQLKEEKPLLEALQKSLLTSLAAQVAAADVGTRLVEYGAILEMACSSAAAAAEAVAAAEAKAAEAAAMAAAAAKAAAAQKFRRRSLLSYATPAAPAPKLPVSPASPAPASTAPALAAALEEFRRQHSISEEEHFMVAATVSQCAGSRLIGLESGRSHCQSSPTSAE